MKKAFLLAAAATAALSGAAQAQVCVGYPSSDRGFYFGGRADFPEALDSFGVEANYNASGPLGVYGGLNVVSVEDLDDSDTNQYFVGAAFEVASLGAFIGPEVSVCPNMEVQFSDEDDSGTVIPVGIGIGGSLGTPGVAIHPYVNPQLVIFNGDGDTETEFGARAGVMLGIGMFSVGGEVRHYFIDQYDPVFGIRFGVRI
jgi:opacity protein-like surface antigen